jgi:hypothetical protein
MGQAQIGDRKTPFEFWTSSVRNLLLTHAAKPVNFDLSQGRFTKHFN